MKRRFVFLACLFAIQIQTSAVDFGLDLLFTPSPDTTLGQGTGVAISSTPTPWLKIEGRYQKFNDGRYPISFSNRVGSFDGYFPINSELVSLGAVAQHQWRKLTFFAGGDLT